MVKLLQQSLGYTKTFKKSSVTWQIRQLLVDWFTAFTCMLFYIQNKSVYLFVKSNKMGEAKVKENLSYKIEAQMRLKNNH